MTRYLVTDPAGFEHAVEVDCEKVHGFENLAHVVPEDVPHRNEKKAMVMRNLVAAMAAGCSVHVSPYGNYQIKQ